MYHDKPVPCWNLSEAFHIGASAATKPRGTNSVKPRCPAASSGLGLLEPIGNNLSNSDTNTTDGNSHSHRNSNSKP